MLNVSPTLQSRVLSIVRIVTGYSFFLHGTAKAFAFPIDNTNFFDSYFSMIGAATILELVLGFLLIIGLFTRVAAFLSSGMMAVGYFMMHLSLFPLANGGEPATLYAFIFLYLAVAGGGIWSVDAALNKNNAVIHK